MARQPIGVHALAGGMVGGEVQVVEAVELAGDVILLKDLKAHGTEGVIQVVAHLGDGVQTTAEGHGAGDGDVKVRVHLGGLHLQLVTALVQQGGQLSFHLVDGLAHLRAQGYVQLGQLLHQLGQAALLAQQRGLDVLQLRLGGDGGDAHFLAAAPGRTLRYIPSRLAAGGRLSLPDAWAQIFPFTAFLLDG